MVQVRNFIDQAYGRLYQPKFDKLDYYAYQILKQDRFLIRFQRTITYHAQTRT
mgnify:CR=1 FL=1